MRHLACAALFVCAGCAPTIIPLSAAVPITATPPHDVPVEVVTHSIARDPLTVYGQHYRARYTDLELSLGHAVSTAVVPWAEAHRDERPGGWQLVVELVKARADTSLDGVITISLDARATLRGRADHVYIAQKQAHCQTHALVPADRAAPLFYDCMMAVGRDLAGWMGGLPQ